MGTSVRKRVFVRMVHHVTQCLVAVAVLQGGKVSSVNRVGLLF